MAKGGWWILVYVISVCNMPADVGRLSLGGVGKVRAQYGNDTYSPASMSKCHTNNLYSPKYMVDNKN